MYIYDGCRLSNTLNIFLFTGFGMCICYLCAFITVSWIFHNAGAPLAFVTVGNSIGQFVFPYVYDALIKEYGWYGTFQLVGAITLHCIPIGVLFYTSRRFYRRNVDDGGSNKHTAAQTPANVSILKDPVILLFVVNVYLFSATGKWTLTQQNLS